VGFRNNEEGESEDSKTAGAKEGTVASAGKQLHKKWAVWGKKSRGQDRDRECAFEKAERGVGPRSGQTGRHRPQTVRMGPDRMQKKVENFKRANTREI